MSRQSQTGGDYSTNVQGAGPVTIIHAGLSPEDAAKLALSLMQSEFDQLRDEAISAACTRAEEFVREKLVPRMMELNPAGVETFADPDVQYALMAAQRTYARSGDEDVADVLVDILVDRTKAKQRSVRQLALTESLDVAAKLTGEQFAALSTIWLIRYTRKLSMGNREALRTYIETDLAPYVPHLTKSNSVYQHLEYAGCGSVGISEVRIETGFRQVYAGIFATGFNWEQLTAAFPDGPPARLEEIIIPCLNDPTRRQFNALDEDGLRQKMTAIAVVGDDVTRAVGLFNSGIMPDDRIRSFLIETHPAMAQLLKVWDDSLMKNMTLTTVGITIAHANCRRTIGKSPADLGIWLD